MKCLDKNILRAWAVHLLAVMVCNQARQRGNQAHIIIVVIIVASTDAVIVTNQPLQLLLWPLSTQSPPDSALAGPADLRR